MFLPTRACLRPLRKVAAPLATVACLAGGAVPAAGQVVSQSNSYFVPQAGSLASPIVGIPAIRLLRACPNNDGGSSLPNRVRIKIVLLDAVGSGISGLTPFIRFNGGTPAQGYTGTGADSVIANGDYNTSPPCPNLDRVDTGTPAYRYMDADGPTDTFGVTYLTFTGPNNVRSPNRKWGHYDCELEVRVVDSTGEVKILGKILESNPNTITFDTSCGDPISTYGFILRIKSIDTSGGLGTATNQGIVVSTSDYNAILNSIAATANPLSFWRDLDWSNLIGPCGGCAMPPCTCTTASDYNLMVAHLTHDCDSPSNP